MSRLIDRIGMLKWLWLSVVFILLDQASKQWVQHSLVLHNPVEIISNLNLYLAYNPGAAFSMFSGHEWARYFFASIAIAVSIALLFWMKSLKSHERFSAISLALIISGAIGNLIDRLLYGHVIDFIQFYYYADICLPGFQAQRMVDASVCVWPTFNIADSAIFCGAAIMIFLSMREVFHDWRARRKQESVNQE